MKWGWSPNNMKFSLFPLCVKLYKLNIHNVVSEFVPLIMNTIMLQVSVQARYVFSCATAEVIHVFCASLIHSTVNTFCCFSKLGYVLSDWNCLVRVGMRELKLKGRLSRGESRGKIKAPWQWLRRFNLHQIKDGNCQLKTSASFLKLVFFSLQTT